MNHEALTAWLTAFVADLLGIAPTQVDPDASWTELGVDSATTLILAADLTAAIGTEVRPVEVLDHPTPTALADYLTSRTAGVGS